MNIQQEIVNKLQPSHSDYQIIPNPDFIHRKEIEERIKENDGYCCCALEKNDDTKCVCKEFREQNTCGFCHCGRFYKVLKAPIVCLCGSTTFKKLFFEVAKKFTLKGYIVIMPVMFSHSEGNNTHKIDKNFLDELHKAKIANADLIYVINQNGYIGDSTRSEIEWAEALGKPIEYLNKI